MSTNVGKIIYYLLLFIIIYKEGSKWKRKEIKVLCVRSEEWFNYPQLICFKSSR